MSDLTRFLVNACPSCGAAPGEWCRVIGREPPELYPPRNGLPNPKGMVVCVHGPRKSAGVDPREWTREDWQAWLDTLAPAEVEAVAVLHRAGLRIEPVLDEPMGTTAWARCLLCGRMRPAETLATAEGRCPACVEVVSVDG